MSEKRPVVVYGASGYTGRLVCEFLRDQQIPFIAAGRDKARIEAALEKVPGIETADYEVTAVPHEGSALARLFEGVKVEEGLLSEKERAMLKSHGAVDAATFVGLVGRAVSGNWIQTGEMR